VATNVGEGTLNEGCGADFVQKAREPPRGWPRGAACGVSIDGDADRAVYFEPRAGGPVALYDGDRIAALAAAELMPLARRVPGLEGCSVGVVQTAYANGESSRYLRGALGCEVRLAKTGVKHLHAAAHEFDVGVYFEANGHGTVLFSARALAAARAAGGEEARALLAFARLVNQSVGDALSVVLLVEAVLRRRGWGMAEWAAMYADLPSRQVKVAVADRSRVATAREETRVVRPEGMQGRIDAAVARYPRARAFVRPSGTEDVVRVYAEAAADADAEALAAEVVGVVEELLA